MVQGVVHVVPRTPTDGDPRLFAYSVSRTADDIKGGAGSRYYPVELSSVLRELRDEEGVFAVVGLPCFIKALRLLARQDEVFDRRIGYFIGLVCGHMKSSGYAGCIAMQCGIRVADLRAISFREKAAGRPASSYSVKLEHVENGQIKTLIRPMGDLLCADWGMGMFKCSACDYCDDVVAETADISLGDAWLPEYVNDGLGTNIVIARSGPMYEILETAKRAGRVVLDDLAPGDIVRSQSAGFRHRRDGLSYRLWLKDRAGEWRPKKRVDPNPSRLSQKYRQIMQLRIAIAQCSHQAFRETDLQKDFHVFRRAMAPYVDRYRALYEALNFPPFRHRVARKVLRAMNVVREQLLRCSAALVSTLRTPKSRNRKSL
jgi:coenzyme F420-reducing hydrogenase beta subunit